MNAQLPGALTFKPLQWLRVIFGLTFALAFLTVNFYLLLFAEEKAAPISVRLESTQNIYSSRQGLMMKLEIIANERAKVCLAKDIMSQLQVKVNKSGVNKALKPFVVTDNSKVFLQETKNKWLEPGQKLTYHINLKRLKFADGAGWLPGEYSTSATYMLCPQTEDKPTEEFLPDADAEDKGDDIPVKTTKPAWFMIMS